MTLIAHMTVGGIPFLLSDVLVSANYSQDTEIALPTRAYIAPEVRRAMTFVPVDFARKIVEVTPKIHALCAGDFYQIREFAYNARNWFKNSDFSHAQIMEFAGHYYQGKAVEFTALIVASYGDSYTMCQFGDKRGEILEGDSPAYGKYYAAGSGAEYFSTIMNYKAPEGAVGPAQAPRSNVLTLCNHLLARELYFGDTFKANFGGAFEVIYLTQNGFQRLDNIQHVFLTVDTLDGKTNVQISPYVIKQWYRGDCLCILSTAPVEEGQRSVLGYVVPSVLSEELPDPQLDDMPLKPNYLCLHHKFLSHGASKSNIMAFSGKDVDVVELKRDGSLMRLDLTPRYFQTLSWLMKLLDGPWR
jgi:hypothetical protein